MRNVKRIITVLVLVTLLAMSAVAVSAGAALYGCSCSDFNVCTPENLENRIACECDDIDGCIARIEEFESRIERRQVLATDYQETNYTQNIIDRNGGPNPWLGDWMYDALPIIIGVVGGLVLLVVALTIISKRRK